MSSTNARRLPIEGAKISIWAKAAAEKPGKLGNMCTAPCLMLQTSNMVLSDMI
jgi:hypothetical protein